MVTVQELRSRKFIWGPEVEDQPTIDPLQTGSDLLWTPRKVATTDEPVLKRTTTPTSGTLGSTSADFSDLQAMDKAGLEDFVDTMNIQMRLGQKPTESDLVRLGKAQRLLWSTEASLLEADPAEAKRLRRAEQAIVDTRRQTTQDRLKAMRDFESAEMQAFRRREGELQEQAKDLQEASQQALSFSGFGRSTFAAEQAADIQKKTNMLLNELAAERDLRIRLEEARLREADEATISRLEEGVANIQQQVFERQLANAELLNQFNLQNTQTYEEKINNIFTMAAQMTTEEELTDDELALADAYASLLIDTDGNINTKLLESIPTQLIGSALQTAAELRGASTTWPVEAQDVVKTDRGTFQRNPETQRYDIPVGVERPAGTTGRGFRTDRHNNPTAMTTDVARTLWMQEGVDFVEGDAFPNNPNLKTARLLGDGIETTIAAFDATASNPDRSIFYTWAGQPRWTYIEMSDQERLGLDKAGKRGVIVEMYKNEWGAGIDQLGVETSVDITDIASLSPLAQSVVRWELKATNLASAVKGSDMTVDDVLAEVSAYRNAQAQVEDPENEEIVRILKAIKKIPRAARAAAAATNVKVIGWPLEYMVPGAANLDAYYDRIRDKLTLDYLIDLKEQGATFGALSEKELDKIAGAVSPLRLSNTNAARQREIDRLIEQYGGVADETIPEPETEDNPDPLGVL